VTTRHRASQVTAKGHGAGTQVGGPEGTHPARNFGPCGWAAVRASHERRGAADSNRERRPNADESNISTGTLLILVLAVAMIAMHLRGHGTHGGGHGGGGGSHGNSEATSASKAPTARVSEEVDPALESDRRRGHQHR